MTTTQQDAYITQAEQVIDHASDLLGIKWRRRGRVGDAPGYGVPEALREAAGPNVVAAVIAERQLVTHGIDVWWNDLLCQTRSEAAQQVRAYRTIDPELIYGEMWHASLGLMSLASTLHNDMLNALGNLMHSEERAALAEAWELARNVGREYLLMHLSEDIAFSCPHESTTPAGVARRLSGLETLECVAAHHVLHDVLPLETKRILVGPVWTMLG